MINKKVLFLVGILSILITFSTLVSAAEDVNIGFVKQGEEIELVQVCDNCTYVNLTKIIDPYKNVLLLGEYEMTKNGSNYNYTFDNTTFVGSYYYTTCGDADGDNVCQTVRFDVTSTGQALTTEKSIIYIVFFGVLLFLFILTLYGINKLPGSNSRDPEGTIVAISNLKYLRSALWFVAWMLIVSMVFLISNLGFAYLGEELFANFFFNIFYIMLAITPLIVTAWFIWIFVQIIQDKKIKRLWERGIFKGYEL